MKVGILTFHCVLNYGAVLQCHGLYRTIKDLGHNVCVIDYRPSYLYSPRQEVGKRMWLTHPLKAYKIYNRTSYNRNLYDKFYNFQHNNWRLTEPIYNIQELKRITDTFDVIIVGSDQVWSPQLNKGDSAWYGFPDSKAKWITYAASAGDACFTDADKTLLRKSLTNFSSISVREEILAKRISEISSDLHPQVVLDPTLLASSEIWKDWSKPIIKGDYIAVYQARANDNTFRIAEAIKEMKGIQNIVVLDNHSNVKRLGYEPYCASPCEFVSIISNAKFLITTSFHGTVFAIISGTPFYTLRLNDGKDERSVNLLSHFKLNERLIDVDIRIQKSDTSSFNKNPFVNTEILLRNISLEYINNSLK